MPRTESTLFKAPRECRNPGPNFGWHTAGYDKLKPYGFPIHDCIDGFSRRVICLKVSRTNNDPAVIAGFFLEAVEELGGCPIILRTGTGTENTVIAAVQSYLRCDGQDEHAGAKAMFMDHPIQSNESSTGGRLLEGHGPIGG